MLQEELYLVLGCFGRSDSADSRFTFVSCRAVENRILKLDESLSHYDAMMDYFESVRLYDKPLFDMNAIRHFLFNMQDRYDQHFHRLWSEKSFNLYERFMQTHKACGIYVKLILINADESPQDIVDEKPIAVQATYEPQLEPQSEADLPSLKLVRTRRQG